MPKTDPARTQNVRIGKFRFKRPCHTAKRHNSAWPKLAYRSTLDSPTVIKQLSIILPSKKNLISKRPRDHRTSTFANGCFGRMDTKLKFVHKLYRFYPMVEVFVHELWWGQVWYSKFRSVQHLNFMLPFISLYLSVKTLTHYMLLIKKINFDPEVPPNCSFEKL